MQQQEEEEGVLRKESTRKYFLQKTSSLPLNSNSSYNSNISYYSDSSYNSNYNSSYNSNRYRTVDVFGVNLSSHGPEDHHHQCTGRRHQSVKLRPSLSSQQVNMVTLPHQYSSSSSHSNLTGTSSKAHRKLSLKHLTNSKKEPSTDLPHMNTEKIPETYKKASRKLSRKQLMRTQAEHRDQLSDLSTTNLSESVQKAPRKLSIKRLRLHRSRAGSSERLSELSEMA